jgi:hypothetical protein
VSVEMDEGWVWRPISPGGDPIEVLFLGDAPDPLDGLGECPNPFA